MPTAHTVGVFDARQHVALDAANTAVLMTAITLDFLPKTRRVRLRTNGTALDLHNFILGFLGRHFASRLDRNAAGSNLDKVATRLQFFFYDRSKVSNSNCSSPEFLISISDKVCLYVMCTFENCCK